MDDGHTAYAIMGNSGWTLGQDGTSEGAHADLYSIDLDQNKIIHKFGKQLRRDSKLLLANGKGFILEPFRKLSMLSFEKENIEKISIGDDLVQLDGMEKSLKHNALFILCEKRDDHSLLKYIRVLDLDTY